MDDQVGQFLFADPDRTFLDSLAADPKAKKFPPMLVDLGQEAQAALSDPNNHFEGIFVNLGLQRPSAVSVIKLAHQKHPMVPIVATYEDDDEYEEKRFTEEEIKQMGVQTAIKKPFTYTEILKRYLAPAHLFDPQETLKHSAKFDEEVGDESDDHDDHFTAIRARNFLAGTKTLFDLYVRLKSGRYLKILQSGDDFDRARLAVYLKKGVSNFYIRTELHEQFLSYCDKIYGALVASPRVSVEAKVTQTFEHGQKMFEYICEAASIGDQELQFVTSYIEHLWKLVDQLKILDKSKIAEALIQDTATCDHGVGTVVVASLLAKKLGFETEKSIHMIGISSLFHDIALYDAPPSVRSENEDDMTSQEIEIFHEHPVKGAKILESIPGIDQAICQAVAQHHRRKDGSGFPKTVAAAGGLSAVSMPGQIVGLADAYARSLADHLQDFQLTGKIKTDPSIVSGFSHDLVTALHTTFKT